MSLFRQVEDHHAAANALGILVPPGRRTVVILRPRALEWDLLAVHAQDGPPLLRQFDRGEAGDVAVSSAELVEAVPHPVGDGFLLRARLAKLAWVACRRVPGQPYQPAVFAT